MNFVPIIPNNTWPSPGYQAVTNFSKFLPAIESQSELHYASETQIVFLGSVRNGRGDRLVIIRRLITWAGENAIMRLPDELIVDVVEPGNLIRQPRLRWTSIVDPGIVPDTSGSEFNLAITVQDFGPSHSIPFRAFLSDDDHVTLRDVSRNGGWKEYQEEISAFIKEPQPNE